MGLRFHLHAVLQPPVNNAELAAVAFNDDGDVACLWAREQGRPLLAFDAAGREAVEIHVPFVRSFNIAVWPDRQFVVDGGAHGLLIDGANCIVVGGYRNNRRVAHLSLARDARAERRGTGRVQGLPDYTSRPFRQCRGPDLHVVIGDRWYRASMP